MPPTTSATATKIATRVNSTVTQTLRKPTSPRTVGVVDKEGQPGARVGAELRERAHYRDAGAVINGERQLIAIPGQPGEHPAGAGTRPSGIFHRTAPAAGARLMANSTPSAMAHSIVRRSVYCMGQNSTRRRVGWKILFPCAR